MSLPACCCFSLLPGYCLFLLTSLRVFLISCSFCSTSHSFHPPPSSPAPLSQFQISSPLLLSCHLARCHYLYPLHIPTFALTYSHFAVLPLLRKAWGGGGNATSHFYIQHKPSLFLDQALAEPEHWSCLG